MSLWILIPLIIWAVGFIVFMGAIILEAPKHKAPLMPIHFAIAAIWPLWGIWYLFVIISDWWEKRK